MQQSDDPEKLEIAIEHLEAERMRRVLEKVQRGEAVFDGQIDIRGLPARDEKPIDEWKPIGRDELGREVYPGPAPSLDEHGRPEPRVLKVFTGVPRGGIEADGVSLDPDEQKPMPSFSQREWLERPPVAKAEPELAPALTPSPPRVVRVQIEAPSEREPGGVIMEAAYTVAGGTLTVTDMQARQIGSGYVNPDDDFDAAARRVVLRERGPSSF